MTRVFLVFGLITWLAAAADRPDTLALTSDSVVKAVNANDPAALVKLYNGEMLAALPTEKTAEFMAGLRNQFGSIKDWKLQRKPAENAAIYRLTMDRGALDMTIAVDGDGKLAGLRFLPAAVDPSEGPQRHETKLMLPFKGKWLVFWGGDTPQTGGHHLQAPAQRFAFDLLGVGPEGKTHSGDGRHNEDYYAFGREVIAPAAGIVTDVISGVRDNKPGEMNPYVAVGNAVLIEHRPGEVSLFAHLQYGSVRVKTGDRVTAGQVLGLAGNSGNSSEPHLHYHLQNSTSFATAIGIKVRFASIVVARERTAETKLDYSPVKGDLVCAE